MESAGKVCGNSATGNGSKVFYTYTLVGAGEVARSVVIRRKVLHPIPVVDAQAWGCESPYCEQSAHEEINMAGYGVAERKTARETKTNPHQCGSCGGRAPKHEELCQSCKDDIFFFNVVIDQIETERG